MSTAGHRWCRTRAWDLAWRALRPLANLAHRFAEWHEFETPSREFNRMLERGVPVEITGPRLTGVVYTSGCVVTSVPPGITVVNGGEPITWVA